MLKIDEMDRKILRQLQLDCRVTSDRLAEMIGLSATACQRRIKRLRDEGVILSETAKLSARYLDRNVTVILQVTLKKGGPDLIDRFKKEMLKLPEVQQIYYVTGDYDFVLIVNARDMAEFDQLTRRMFREVDYFQRFQSTVVIDNVKVSTELPI